MKHLVEILEWDSNFFGFPVASVVQPSISKDDWTSIREFVAEKGVRLLYFKCQLTDRDSVDVAQINAFSLVDVRLDYVLNLQKKWAWQRFSDESGPVLTKAKEVDLHQLSEMVTRTFENSRYYADKKFDPEKIDEFYVNWIERSIKGEFDDEVLVVKEEGVIQSLCSLKYETNKNARIGLFAVNQELVGTGVGSRFLFSILTSLAEKGLSKVSVVTQGSNLAAQNTYAKCGFQVHDMSLYFHHWVRVESEGKI